MWSRRTLRAARPPKKVFSSIPKAYWDMMPEEKEAWGLQLAEALQQKLRPRGVGEASS